MTRIVACFSFFLRRYFFFQMVLAALLPAGLQANADPAFFPHYSSISANVAFWEKIYSTYSVNTAIIHDREDLRRVYAIIDLADQNQPGAAHKNEALVAMTKKRYVDLLLRLVHAPPQTAEEKRVAALFPGKPDPATLKQAAGAIRSQTGLKERFIEGVIRSGAYLRTFKRVFRSHGLPEDLAYLPHVESSFNPRAFSKFGAAGMWQFTTGTGQQYLRIDYIIDERRDPFLSAEAAARFLKSNHRVLESWPLALTAYNYGTAGMKRAVREHGAYEQIFHKYRKGWFKFAARNFYPSFLAAVKVAKHFEKSGTLTLDRPVASVSVRVPGFVASAALCNHLGISQATLARYNPALRDPVLQGEKYIPKDYLLNLPAELKNSAALTSLPAALFYPEQKRSLFYQVRPGDTAGAVALAHKVPLKRLIEVNGLDHRATVRVGQNLRIPAASTSHSPSPKAPSRDIAVVTLANTKKSEPMAAAVAAPPPVDLTVSGNLKVFDTTRKGDLLSGRIETQPDETIDLLAHWLKVTPQSLRLANHLADQADVAPGRTITVDFVNVPIAVFEIARFDFHQEKQEDFFKTYNVVDVHSYTVKPGDTLWELCYNTFEIPLWLLKKYNDELSFTRLDSSTTLQIPVIRAL
ncbi:LysM peptidoglycan-binding domain-containing protein [Desulfofustis glycolicus]|uniref:Membrane-bound lytic murein transglycosylase D n=1 Tax=Desulfofustis glycolicus DSM 9705 TaxID=1121409 RepID=A0A1M5VA61_9BACT|nr:LysM peptidoglycan-binding domain-containing protein [Desulfofustis glycolicus]SHH71813.1 membrane-bound lytic murein transglycosylase D [Desulfofustis glycolicus DSM 9705]